jgi:hypothetical protein
MWIAVITFGTAIGLGLVVLALAQVFMPGMDAAAVKRLGDMIGLPVMLVSIFVAVWLVNQGKLPGTKKQ